MNALHCLKATSNVPYMLHVPLVSRSDTWAHARGQDCRDRRDIYVCHVPPTTKKRISPPFSLNLNSTYSSPLFIRFAPLQALAIWQISSIQNRKSTLKPVSLQETTTSKTSSVFEMALSSTAMMLYFELKVTRLQCPGRSLPWLLLVSRSGIVAIMKHFAC